jgi:hypothetical protein
MLIIFFSAEVNFGLTSATEFSINGQKIKISSKKSKTDKNLSHQVGNVILTSEINSFDQRDSNRKFITEKIIVTMSDK